jgi:ferredoxin
MSDLQSTIQARAAKLLTDGSVKVVLGFEAGTAPFRVAPAFIERPEDASRLVWNDFCVSNLSVFLPDELKRADKVAIIAKGCDARSAVIMLAEHQALREQVIILGVPCRGMLDLQKVAARAELGELTAVQANGGEEVVLSLRDGERRLPRLELLAENCLTCQHNTPPVADELLAEPADPMPAAGTVPAALEELERLSPEERRAYWRVQLERCIRCYACREACPSCYCPTCFVDKTAYRWVSKATTPDENWMFHSIRAYHMVGRCTECGECQRVCPMNIPLLTLQRVHNREVADRFGYVAGMDPAVVPPMGTFSPDDRDPAEGHK